ncbi:MAG: helix-turn-helix domain-containing protein [Eubacteriales bacterium]|nr:helix-turn-helix domain-containing protein [Eubacteriales bacterium]
MKALVVDDDRNTVEVILKSVHWETLGIQETFYAYEIAGARKILGEEEVDIVICDIEMPMGTGIDLIIWARENEIKSEFLFLTCHESFEFASYAIQYQAAAYLIKPFVPEKMELELHKLICRIEREQNLEESLKYRNLWMDSREYLELGFWEDLLAGRIPASRDFIEKEIEKRNLSFSVREPWSLLLVSARKYGSAWEEWEEETLTARRTLNVATLQTIQVNLTQIVYVYLYKNGIWADELFSDKAAMKLRNRAANSAVDMMKWQNHLIRKTVDSIREVKESDSIIRKIKNYVREHYREDIGRNEVAAVVYLTPEYMAKLFKRDTGLNLKDYIHQVRIQEAKRLLAGGTRVSEVAQKVGFDNFSYFSTVFKRVTGLSPNEYKRAGEGMTE